MSQIVWNTINPLTTSGLMLAGILDDFKDALMTGLAGSSRPSNLQFGGIWVDTTNQAAPNYYWSLKIYTSAGDIEYFRVSILNGVGGPVKGSPTFTIKETANDAVGPFLELIKNRIANNAQDLDGDTVAEIRFVGRTNTATDPVVGYFKFTATDNMTSSASGGTFSFYSTPDASNTITEHMRFISGLFETLVPHKINSEILVNQNIATTATITQLSTSKILAEFTGSTATDIQSIDSSGSSLFIILHNRSTANVTLKHENTSGSAIDRIKLPNALDHILVPNDCAGLYYCSTDARWKLVHSSTRKFSNGQVEKLIGGYNEWTCPSGVSRIHITAYADKLNSLSEYTILDKFGNTYSWGANTNGQLGLGDVTPRSSPVAVLGGFQFAKIDTENASSFAIDYTGTAYSWGNNTDGRLGIGNTTVQSSPVAILGGIKFSKIIHNLYSNTYGMTKNGEAYAWGIGTSGELGSGASTSSSSPVAVVGGIKFSRIFNFDNVAAGQDRSGNLYGWGNNPVGNLGVGDRTNRSSPVAVVGGLKFKKFILSGITGASNVFNAGLTIDGILYAWGSNDKGQLGVGDTTNRSSPVAVLGGLTFVDIFANAEANCIFGLTSNGTAYAWGANNVGQLGVGDTTNRSSPVAVLGGLSFREIIPGPASQVGVIAPAVFGITTTGVTYAWGLNTKGALGVGDTTVRSSPVAVLGGLSFYAIRGAFDGSQNPTVKAITYDGTIYAWGSNPNGQLGVGDVTARSSPVAVLTSQGVDNLAQIYEMEISVTPGQVYPVILSQAESNFGTTPIGVDIDYITIEYDK